MRFTFRRRLLTLIFPAAIAFVILIIAQSILAEKMANQVATIQKKYIPIIEFGPKIESDFEHLRRSFQDSVAAQDAKSLQKAAIAREQLLGDVKAANAVIASDQVLELGRAIEEYSQGAESVSKRLIAGETGTALVGAMTDMQSKQARVSSILRESLTFDRAKLVTAFSVIDRTQATSSRTLIAISIACLVVVLGLSGLLSRNVLSSLALLSSGLGRFGKGDFSEPITVTTHDELEDLAQDANQMAARVRSLMKELESFSYSVAHDLRAPLRSMLGFSNAILEDHGGVLPQEVKDSLGRVIHSTKRMGQLVDSLLSLSRLARVEIKRDSVNLSLLAEGILKDLKSAQPERKAAFSVEPNVVVKGDPSLLHVVFTNLLSNAWKFTSKKPIARIEIGVEERGDTSVYFVRDNGAGFDMQYSGKLFGTFQRLHSNDDFDGTGIGLATVQTIIHRHGGEIWAEGKPDEGASFFFTLWQTPKQNVNTRAAFAALQPRGKRIQAEEEKDGNANHIVGRG